MGFVVVTKVASPCTNRKDTVVRLHAAVSSNQFRREMRWKNHAEGRIFFSGLSSPLPYILTIAVGSL